MEENSLKVLVEEAESTMFTDELLRIIYCLQGGVQLSPERQAFVDKVEDIICYLNVKAVVDE
jgi:hypothetical protein